MQYNIIKISVVCLLIWPMMELCAQVSVNATGGYAIGGGGEVNYSVGVIAPNFFVSATGSVLGGVQQPYEMSVVTNIQELSHLDVTFYSYPFDCTHILSIEAFDGSGLSCQLSDITGKLLLKQPITTGRTPIVLSKFVPAIYLLTVFKNRSKVKTFKIIIK